MMGDKVTKSAKQFRKRKLFRQDDSGMGTVLCLPLHSELMKVLAVEGAKNSSVLEREDELLFIATAQIVSISSGEAVKPMRDEKWRQENGNILIEV